MNLIDFFDAGVRRWPERACFVVGPRQWSFRQIDELTHQIAGGLLGSLVADGAKCAVLSANDPLAFACTLGILRAGAVWVPLNPRNSAHENAHLLSHFDCEVLFFQKAFAELVGELKSKCPHLRMFICIDGELDWASPLQSWMADPATRVPQRASEPQRLAMMVPTGGTTGLPKGVMLSNRNVATFCANVLATLHFVEPPVCLACAPLTHAAGIFAFPMMAIGATHIVHAAVDPQAILSDIERHGVNFLFLPPTAIYALLVQPNVREFDYSSLRYLLYGASPMAPAKLAEAIDVFGPVLAQMFGQSEAPASITYLSPKDHFDSDGRLHEGRLKSCGAPTPFVRAEIMADDGTILGPGEIGEIVVQGDLVMMGYYKNPAATQEASAYGWHHTGDLAYRDEESFFYIVDRKKDLIISGGMNVYATEVEQAVLRHPSVQDCAVFGVPDEKWGEAVKAVIELKPGLTVEPEVIIAHCKSLLGSQKAPKSVDIIERLPRSSVGKVLKRELRSPYWAGQERAVS